MCGWGRVGNRSWQVLAQLFAAPWVAIILGFPIGVGLFAPLAWSSRLVTQGNADVGLVVVTGAVMVGLIATFALLLGYRIIAPGGVAYFGLALVAGYLGALGVYTVISIKKLAGDKHESLDETRR
jgi:hypothetical protein